MWTKAEGSFSELSLMVLRQAKRSNRNLLRTNENNAQKSGSNKEYRTTAKKEINKFMG